MDALKTTWLALPLSGSLRRQVMLFVVLPLLLLTALGTRLALQEAKQFHEARLTQDLELIAKVVGIPVGRALDGGDREALQLALQSVFALGEVYGVSVFDAAGERIAAAGITERNLAITPIPDEIKASGQQAVAYREVAGSEVFSHFTPVFGVGGRVEGLIQLNRRASDFSDAVRQMTLLAWLIWAVFALGIIVAVAAGHYRGVGRHVDALLQQMRAVAGGARQLRAAVAGPSELRALAQEFNGMLEGIESAEREVAIRQQAEQAMAVRLRDSERLAAIGSVASGIAHELGAPLSVVDGRARRLQALLGDQPEPMRHLAGIRAQVDRLTRTVRQLLDYARPEGVSQQPLSLRETLKSALAAIQPEADEAGIRFDVDLGDEDAGLIGDRARLELALLNLLRNALQAARTRVQVRCDHNAQELQIAILDDGPGLPDMEISRLRQPFVTTKAPGEGTGLGLAITDAVAREHGARLNLRSVSGAGCEAVLAFSLTSITEEAS